MFKMMKSSHIGLHHPEFFLHWADFELKVDRRDKSLAVLSSSHETPIMRGNAQISEAKALIESHRDLKLQPLFTLNSAAAINSKRTSPCDTLDEKMMQIRRNAGGLGPPKRIKELEDKENNNSKSNFNFSNNNTMVSTNSAAPSDRSGNSNMSLTLTELNVNIVQSDPQKMQIVSPETEPVSTAFNDTGTYNLTNTNNFNNNDASKVPSKPMVVSNSNSTATVRSRQVRVNGKIYRVLQLIGRGGSSKVFSVIDGDGQIFALKKVNLKNLDEVTLASYVNEIALLKSFANNPHIIQLIDSEMNQEQACLYILMEYGEVDLGKMLKKRVESGQVGERVDENFVRFSFQQVRKSLQCLQCLFMS